MKKGSYYYDASSNQGGFQQAEKVDVVDTTGAGDSFFAGTVSGLVKGKSLAEAVHLGTKVAGCTISSPESTCQDLKEKIGQKQI